MKLVAILFLLLVTLLFLQVPGVAAQGESRLAVRYWPDEQTIENLVQGGIGEGLILYYLTDKGVEQPALVVRLSRNEGEALAYAEVFQSPPGRTSVPIRIVNDTITSLDTVQPAIVLQSLDGQWVHNQQPVFNLDIQVNGQIYSMWGGGYTRERGPQSWNARVGPNQPAANIMVRDPHGEGLPKWDLRILLPEFSSQSYYRTNYAERRCQTPTRIDYGVSPLWPFVSDNGGYEQEPGVFRPPIVVDWQQGKITHFSEFVSVRHQNCSYSAYGINRLEPGMTNQLNFETPFAFYDLSGDGNGLPNLILRTARFPAHDPWSTGLDPKIQREQPVQRDTQLIRYSWRSEIGDYLWDYKIEVMGFHPYTFETPIAGGLASIDAPPYDLFPRWVLDRSWPIVIFIDTEGNSYRSSEGIYEWSPSESGIDYTLGWVSEPNPKAYTNLDFEFRGEYRLRQNLPARLYMSPIDNRLHLIGAEGGLWRLGPDLVLRVQRQGNERYITSWTRERVSIVPGAPPRADLSRRVAVEETLYAMPGHLLHADDAGVTIRRASYEPALFEIEPPSDRTSWQTFRNTMQPFNAQRRDPGNLRSWLDGFPGQTLTLPGARVSDVRQTPQGFRCVLDLPVGFQTPANSFLNLNNLAPGRYVVSYDGGFTVSPLTPPTITGLVQPPTLTQHTPATFVVSLRNEGLQDLTPATLELWASFGGSQDVMVVSETVTLLAQSDSTTPLVWTPPLSGTWNFTPKVRSVDGGLITLTTVSTQARPSATVEPMNVLLAGGITALLPFALLALSGFAALGGVLLWQHWGNKLPTKERPDEHA